MCNSSAHNLIVDCCPVQDSHWIMNKNVLLVYATLCVCVCVCVYSLCVYSACVHGWGVGVGCERDVRGVVCVCV